jgi:single-stranded-DNA-specific exonuclease
MPKSYSVKEKVSSDLVEQLLHNRGIHTKEEKEQFLNPDFEKHLHDPLLMSDMGKAVDRILWAIEKGEKMGVWSDYDADGIPGGALLHDFFKLIGYTNFLNYIPDRHDEGYGMNKEGLEKLNEENIRLLITVDCGIRDVEQVAYANKHGMEIIITDHHEPGEDLPDAYAIVNPKLKNSTYPEQVLCGSGVVWKIIEAILKKKPELIKEGQKKWLLDLVGLATLSDMVPLTGENRVMAHFGLKVLRKTRRPGLQKLYEILRMNRATLSEDDIAFMITPRINAASRMGKPRDAFELLIEGDYGKAEILARHLNSINNERKGVVAGIVKEAKKHIKSRFESHGEKAVIVMGNPLWRPALLGLAANSIAEEFNRPVFLWGRDNGNGIKGSCRSEGETDVVALMERANGHLSDFGGHKMSGGFSVSNEKVHTLEEALLEASPNTAINRSILDSVVLADTELRINEVNERTVNEINRLAPFGMGNEKPVFIFHNVIADKINHFGKAGEHLSVTLRDGSHTAKAISFFSNSESFPVLQEGRNCNVVANMEKSFFGGRREIRLRIVDFF